MRPAHYVALASFLVVAPLAAQRPSVVGGRFTLQVGQQTIPLLEIEGLPLQPPEVVEDKLGPDQVSQKKLGARQQPFTIRVAREYESILSAWRKEVITVGPGKAASTVTISARDYTGRVVRMYTLTRAWPRVVAETVTSVPGAQRVFSAELDYESLNLQTP